MKIKYINKFISVVIAMALCGLGFQYMPSAKASVENDGIYLYADFEEAIPDELTMKNGCCEMELAGKLGNRFLQMPALEGEQAGYFDCAVNATPDFMVMEFSISMSDYGREIYLMTLCDNEKNYSPTVLINRWGQMRRADTRALLCQIDNNEKLISIVYSFSDNTYDIYIDREIVCENADGNKSFNGNIKLIRSEIKAYNDNERIVMNLDKMKIYESSQRSLYSSVSSAEVRSSFMSTGNGVHPRLIATQQDFQRIKDNRISNPIVKRWSNLLINRADTSLSKACASFEGDGSVTDRMSAQTQSALDTVRINSFAYIITDDTKYADRVWEEVNAVCAFESWHPEHFLDTSELSCAVAIAYDWLYDYWTDEQKTLMENKIVNFALVPALNEYNGNKVSSTDWTGGEAKKYNWNMICTAGMALGALAIADTDNPICFDVLSRGIFGVQPFFEGFFPDGGYLEGPFYWSYATQYMSIYFKTLSNSLGTDYGLSDFKGMESSGSYFMDMLSGSKINNYSDGEQRYIAYGSVLWFGERYDDPELIKRYLYQTENSGVQPSVYDIIFYSDYSLIPEISRKSNDTYYRNAEAVTMHSDISSENETFVSFHGGKVNAPHYHADNGAFIYYAMGEEWAIDPGHESYPYENGYDSRANAYRCRAEGHNAIVINPDESIGMNENGTSVVTAYGVGGGGAYAVTDMTQLYDAQSVRRGIKLTDDRRRFTVRDEIIPNGSSEIYWFMHTKADIELTPDGAILSQNGKKVVLKYTTSANECTLSQMNSEPLPTSPNPSGQTDNSDIKKLAFKINSDSEFYLEVTMSPQDYSVSNKECDNIVLDSWQADNSPTAPTASDIYVAGSKIGNFDRALTAYTAEITTGFPTVTVDTVYNYNVKYYDGFAIAKIYDEQNEDNYTVYKIDFVQKASCETYAFNNYTGYAGKRSIIGQALTYGNMDYIYATDVASTCLYENGNRYSTEDIIEYKPQVINSATWLAQQNTDASSTHGFYRASGGEYPYISFVPTSSTISENEKYVMEYDWVFDDFNVVRSLKARVTALRQNGEYTSVTSISPKNSNTAEDIIAVDKLGDIYVLGQYTCVRAVNNKVYSFKLIFTPSKEEDNEENMLEVIMNNKRIAKVAFNADYNSTEMCRLASFSDFRIGYYMTRGDNAYLPSKTFINNISGARCLSYEYPYCYSIKTLKENGNFTAMSTANEKAVLILAFYDSNGAMLKMVQSEKNDSDGYSLLSCTDKAEGCAYAKAIRLNSVNNLVPQKTTALIK